MSEHDNEAYIAFVDNPTYSETWEQTLAEAIAKITDMIETCAKFRVDFFGEGTGMQWYVYKNEIRRVYDAASLVEHDLFLLGACVTHIRDKNWRLKNQEEADT